MKIHFQIEYHRPAKDDKEREFDGEKIRVETLSAIDLSTKEGKEFIHEILDEFLNNYHHFPDTAKLEIGGVCTCHEFDLKDKK